MNLFKYLPLILSIIILDAHAETIDVHEIPTAASLSKQPNGSAAQVCRKFVFITKNTGTLITGLTVSKLKLLSAYKVIINTTKYKSEISPITIRLSLGSMTQPGYYNLCMTPIDFTWTLSSLPSSYYFNFIVNGAAATDHGVFLVSIYNSDVFPK
jgi:hypothetical protein